MKDAAEGMFTQMMASMAHAAQRDASCDGAVLGANASSKVEFFERSNAVDESVEGVFSRMTFTGCFAIDEFMIQHKDGSPVEAGLGADFDEANGPFLLAVIRFCPARQGIPCLV